MRPEALSVRTELALMLAAVLGPLLGLIGYGWYERYQADLRYATTLVTHHVDISAAEAAQRFEVMRASLQVIAERPFTKRMDPAHCDPALADFRAANPWLINISVVDRTGRVQCTARPMSAPEPVVLADRDWYPPTMAGTPFFVGKPVFGRVSKRWLATVSASVRDGEGKVIGAVVMALDLWSWPFPSTPNDGSAQALLSIIDAEGTIVARSEAADKFVGTNVRHSDITERVLQQHNGVVRTSGLDSVERVFAFKRVANTDWYAIAGIPVQAAFAESRSYAIRSGLLALIGVTLAVAFAYAITRRSERISAAIVGGVRRGLHGESTGLAAVRGPREVRQLARDLDRVLVDRAAAAQERARTETALRESEERFRRLTQISSDWYWEQDAEHRITLMKGREPGAVGRDGEHTIGKTHWELPGIEPIGFTWEDHRRTLDAHQPFRDLLTHWQTDGESGYVRISGEPIFDEAGAFCGYRGVTRDVTLEYLAQRRIDLVTRLYAALSEVNEAVARSSEPLALFRDVCRICCERASFSLAYVALVDGNLAVPVVGHGATSFIEGLVLPLDPERPEDRPPLAIAVRSMQPNISNDFESDPVFPQTLRERGARIGTRAAAAFPLIVNGKAIGALSLHARQPGFFEQELIDLLGRMVANVSYALEKIEQDAVVTRTQAELAQLNRELEERVRRRTVDLEAANRELESFSYSVSHDLRAPVRHIDGFVRLLREELGAGASKEVNHYVDRISVAAHRMGVLIDDLLTFSRTARASPACRAVELNTLVREVIGELNAETAGRKIKWSIEPLPRVSADPTLLRLVLQNLIGNALKYTRTRESAEIEIGADKRAPGDAVIHVRDNGVGFDMRYSDKLFGVFQRLHREQDFEGTGIGLATAQRIVHRHGGEIWGEGAPDQGAKFSFTIALAES
jgi:PAS domain S-box-containing protein